MFNKIVITNLKSKLSKEININEFNPMDLNIISKFYESHKDFIVERI